ncbi:MAG: hypothetical protein LJE89_16175 [Deltaproteobacteria bacterium]|nr:hypothetical protein [Deltaproteobacteria bacterium]
MKIWALNDTKVTETIKTIKTSKAIISAKVIVFSHFFALYFFPLSPAADDLLGVDLTPWPMIAPSA